MTASPHKPRPPRNTHQPPAAALVPQALLRWSTLATLAGSSETSLRRRRAVDPGFPPLLHVDGIGSRFRAADVVRWLDGLATVTESAD